MGGGGDRPTRIYFLKDRLRSALFLAPGPAVAVKPSELCLLTMFSLFLMSSLFVLQMLMINEAR